MKGAGWQVAMEQINRLALKMDAEQFFDFLENFIDQAREILNQIPDPKLKASLRESYEMVIDYALELKLSQLCRTEKEAKAG